MNTTLTAPSATTVAIDLAKDVFELAYVDADGRIAAVKQLVADRWRAAGHDEALVIKTSVECGQ